MEKLCDSPPEPFAPAERPLSGIKVVDMAHVIAGPVSARVLAEQGAEVLHVSAPLAPDDFRVVLDTGFGKRSAFVDLNNDGFLDLVVTSNCSRRFSRRRTSSYSLSVRAR